MVRRSPSFVTLVTRGLEGNSFSKAKTVARVECQASMGSTLKKWRGGAGAWDCASNSEPVGAEAILPILVLFLAGGGWCVDLKVVRVGGALRGMVPREGVSLLSNGAMSPGLSGSRPGAVLLGGGVKRVCPGDVREIGGGLRGMKPGGEGTLMSIRAVIRGDVGR